jgi:hypothetical protein
MTESETPRVEPTSVLGWGDRDSTIVALSALEVGAVVRVDGDWMVGFFGNCDLEKMRALPRNEAKDLWMEAMASFSETPDFSKIPLYALPE